MDAVPFRSLAKPGYDVIVAYDYSAGEPALDARLARYREVVVVAWSFGVRAAADFLRSTHLPVSRTIAVNGTESHIDDRNGIPEAIFRGTLDGLSERTVEKFRRRMCGSADAYSRFCERLPERPFESLKAELEVFAAEKPLKHSVPWSLALVGDSDMIIPTRNQLNFWGETNRRILRDTPHLVDLQQVIDLYVVDKELVASRFGRAVKSYTGNAAVQEECAHRLSDALVANISETSSFDNVLEVGVGQGTLTAFYTPKIRYKELYLCDIAPMDATALPAAAHLIQGDAELEILRFAPGSLDLILSSSALQWFNSPPEFIRNAATRLAPGGVIALSYFTPETLTEVSSITGISLDYPSHSTLVETVERSGLKPLTHAAYRLQADFDSPLGALRHLQSTGVNAICRNGSANRAALKLLRNLPAQPDGKCSLTYAAAYIIAKKI